MKTVLRDQTFARTLTQWTREVAATAQAGDTVTFWVFDDQHHRQVAEKQLRALGIEARVLSAYKPLVHYFIEDVELDGLAHARVHYPVQPHAEENRYTLEAFPLAGILGTDKLEFVAAGDVPFYDVDLRYTDGRTLSQRVLVPNRAVVDFLGETVMVPAGWVRHVRADGTVMVDEARETDAESLYAAFIDTLKTHDWGTQEPYFERLTLSVVAPDDHRVLAYDLEAMSLCEAWHEDLYFSALEFFQKHSGRPAGDRHLQPGQIVPQVRAAHANESLRLEIHTETDVPVVPTMQVSAPEPLSEAQGPLTPTQIVDALGRIGRSAFVMHTLQGREVHAVHVPGQGPAVFISGGQHANETSGVVGALRAAQILQRDTDTHFVLMPLENPDGYALHQQYIQAQPRHMHHAARYSALGDDLAFRQKAPLHEADARRQAVALSGAQLHINLHGYPAHEWTRPFSGYLPRGFGLWTIPKGFFLVLRHHPGYRQQAERLVQAVTEDLSHIADLMTLNARQAQIYRHHALHPTFDMLHGIPVRLEESEREETALTLITEFPDETIWGERFVLAHECQMRTVLAAVRAYRAGLTH